MKFAEVILPLPLENTYTYLVPDEMEALVQAHFRVVVPFGSTRSYTAIVKEIHEHRPEASSAYTLKPITSVPDTFPVLHPRQMIFWEWIASYYLCKPGEVYKAAVPTGLLKRSGSTRRKKTPAAAAVPPTPPLPLPPPGALTEAQQAACDAIRQTFTTKQVCLLHGVPSCGKTEIYLRLAQETLRQGRDVLYLLPEIAVTERLTERLSAVAGHHLRVYHSGCTDRQRVEVWNHLLQSGGAAATAEPVWVVGLRSALFLPFANLGLIIVDDEQDPSFRQHDPAPRYHARNAAVMLAAIHGAKTLLGSVAPSLDSFYNARSGKYGYVALKDRFGAAAAAPPPHVHLVDTKELRRRKIMKDTLFSPLLKDEILAALGRDEQVILFQNRRGFAPIVECKNCSLPPRCIRCDVSLTLHKQQRRLVCHYCGYSIAWPARCPTCGSEEMKLIGFGTEKMEEETATLFPGVAIGRLDWDTAHTRKAYREILTDFEQRKTAILIGTQMLSKGFDFERVSVVGLLNVDNLMNAPDFRAFERAFQLMVQLSGCAGGGGRPGTVIIQTSQPEHPLLQMMRNFDYEAMAYAQLSERQMFRYPPFFRLITIVLRSRDEAVLEALVARYADLLREDLGARVSPPFASPVNRIQALHERRIVLKLERDMTVAQTRLILNKNSRIIQNAPDFKRLDLHYEID
jgi:primosomal protein N' (replication factor Y)